MTFSAQFTDSSGTRWTVFESPANRITFDDRVIEEAPSHLTFEATLGARTYLRRLQIYPSSWRELSVASLEDLLHRASTVGGARKGAESEETRRSIDHLTT